MSNEENQETIVMETKTIIVKGRTIEEATWEIIMTPIMLGIIKNRRKPNKNTGIGN